jgi:hypothetical protein
MRGGTDRHWSSLRLSSCEPNSTDSTGSQTPILSAIAKQLKPPYNKGQLPSTRLRNQTGLSGWHRNRNVLCQCGRRGNQVLPPSLERHDWATGPFRLIFRLSLLDFPLDFGVCLVKIEYWCPLILMPVSIPVKTGFQ